MNKLCDECEQLSQQKFAVKSSYCIFAVRPKNFHFSSLKEIENQLKSLKKVLAENNMARTFALPKMGGQKGQRSLKVGKQQHVPI